MPTCQGKLLCTCVIVVLTCSLFLVFPVRASTLSLHTSGTQILDSDNNPVYFRGIGLYTGASGAPDWLFWNSATFPNSDNWGDQWNFSENPEEEQAAITTTMSTWENTWHVNLIRVFIYPGLFPIVEPSQQDSCYSGDNTQYDILTSLKGLCEIAQEYGIYVDICPAGITSYATGTWASWTSSQWTTFWTAMADGLGSYPNAIFEAWNEPSEGSNGATGACSSYVSYVETFYNAIRGTGANNLIFIQWYPGWIPNGWGMNLSWAAQFNSALNDPTNVVYTTHLYYYSPSDNTPYWDENGVDADAGGQPLNETEIQTDLSGLINSMGVNAPLVVNEFGDCISSSACGPSYSQDYSWFNSVCQATANLGIGLTAYYWDSVGNVAPDEEGLLSAALTYAPNIEGTDFINAYIAPLTPAATPSPTLIPTPAPLPTPTAKPTPQLPLSIQKRLCQLISFGGLGTFTFPTPTPMPINSIYASTVNLGNWLSRNMVYMVAVMIFAVGFFLFIKKKPRQLQTKSIRKRAFRLKPQIEANNHATSRF